MKSLLLSLSTFVCVHLHAQITVFQSDLSTPSSYLLFNNGGGDWVVGNSGPTGSTAQFMGPINSSTPNEFALFDSQALGGIQQSGVIQMSNSVDVSNYTYAYVCFQSYYKHDAGTCNVQVSNDGGATWYNFGVHTSLMQGDSTANPSMELVDISVIASNQPAVLFRFAYEGPAGYAWMIDDICMLANNSPIIGLEEDVDEIVRVFPNPTNGVITVDLHNIQGEANVQITDLQGRVVLSETASPSVLTLDLEVREEPGTYFLTVEHEGGRARASFVKQ